MAEENSTTRPGRRSSLKAAVRAGWSGVWARPEGGLRRSGGLSAQPAAARKEASGRGGVGGAPGFLAVGETKALAVQLQDVDVMGQAVQQSSCEPFGTKDFGPFIKG